MVFNKKAISPVVATALLLVVAVVAVVGFQTWFNTYQSGLNAKVEDQSNTGSSVTIEGLMNGTVYLKNTAAKPIAVDSVIIYDKTDSVAMSSCNTSTITSLAAKDVTSGSITGCTLASGKIYTVTVVTNEGVYSGNKLVQ